MELQMLFMRHCKLPLQSMIFHYPQTHPTVHHGFNPHLQPTPVMFYEFESFLLLPESNTKVVNGVITCIVNYVVTDVLCVPLMRGLLTHE